MDHIKDKPKIFRFWIRNQGRRGGLFRPFVRHSDYMKITKSMQDEISQLKARESRLLKKLSK